MKYDDDYSNGHINLFAPRHHESKQPKSILKHTNYRTKNPPNNDSTLNKSFDDLNLRGYTANLYRDDFNALKIESKDNLIPWNGDQNLLIDKYDCRLYLHDLTPYDADYLTDDARQPNFTHEENETENLCEFERYLDLVEDENVNDTDQCDSSASKRTEIGYTYETNEVNVPAKEEPKHEKLFVPDENLRLPIGIACPETVKHNQLIVKTASFVAKQGLQAEILLKTKQSTNSQFGFLNYGDLLHAYYKHVINLIRDKKIDPFFYLQQETEIAPESSESENSDDDDTYLHPLLSKAPIKPDIPVPKDVVVKDNEMKNQVEIETPLNEPNDTKPLHEEPKGNEKTVIDKLAEYVSRNGIEFEDNLKKKNDPRFDFINPGHKFYEYYTSQVELLSQKVDDEKKEDVEKELKREKSRKKSESNDSESSSSSSEESDNVEKKKRHRKKSKDSKKHHKSKHSKSRKHRDSSPSRKKHKKRSKSRH